MELRIDLTSLVIGSVFGSVFALLGNYTVTPNELYSTKDLDMAIVNKTIDATTKYCRRIKAKHYRINASGLNVKSGC